MIFNCKNSNKYESGVCGMECIGRDYYFQKNMLGDICAIYNALGELVCRYVYDAWGNHKIYDKAGNEIPDDGSTVASINPFRYRGYYWDREFKLYYLKSRYYDPEVGRFISPDGIKYLKPNNICGMNLYAYCNNNPIMNVDPDGQIAGLLIGVLVFLGVVTVAGGVTAGVVSYQSGKRGWDVVWDVLLGAGLGLAAGGALVALMSVTAGLIAGPLVGLLGTTVTAAQLFSIGALAFNVFPMLIAPFMGIDDATAIELEGNPYSPPDTSPTPPFSYI